MSERLGVGKLLLSWADGPEYSSQFNIPNSKRHFPAFILLSKIEGQRKEDKKLGRLPDDMVEFTTFVYKRKHFGKPTPQNVMKWINMTGTILAYNEYEERRLLNFYDFANSSGIVNRNSTRNSSAIGNTTTKISIKNGSDVDRHPLESENTSNTSAPAAAIGSNASNATSSMYEDLEENRDPNPVRYSHPASAFQRLFSNLNVLGIYERLVERRLKEEKGEGNLTLTDKLFAERVLDIRKEMHSKFPPSTRQRPY